MRPGRATGGRRPGAAAGIRRRPDLGSAAGGCRQTRSRRSGGRHLAHRAAHRAGAGGAGVGAGADGAPVPLHHARRDARPHRPRRALQSADSDRAAARRRRVAPGKTPAAAVPYGRRQRRRPAERRGAGCAIRRRRHVGCAAHRSLRGTAAGPVPGGVARGARLLPRARSAPAAARGRARRRRHRRRAGDARPDLVRALQAQDLQRHHRIPRRRPGRDHPFPVRPLHSRHHA